MRTFYGGLWGDEDAGGVGVSSFLGHFRIERKLAGSCVSGAEFAFFVGLQ